MSENSPKKQETLSPALHTLRTLVIMVVLFLLFAYATEATEINLDDPQDPKRQETALRALRSLSRPDLFVYSEETRSMDIKITLPCGEEIKGSQFTSIDGGRVVKLSPNCANTTQDKLTATGTGFRPNTSGILRWYPPGDVATTRALTSFSTDSEGNFEVEFTMSDIRPTAEPQRIQVEEKWQTGITGLSEASWVTIEKLTETVLLALLATTVGTIGAIPLSFVASRNLMESVGAPLASIMGGLVTFVAGYYATYWLTAELQLFAAGFNGQPLIQFVAAGVALGVTYAILSFGPPIFTDEPPPTQQVLINAGRILLASLAAVLGLSFLAQAGFVASEGLASLLGPFAFVGNFLALLAEFFNVIGAWMVAITAACVAYSLGSHYGQELVLKAPTGAAKIFTAVITLIGTFCLVYGIGAFLHWLYDFNNDPYWPIASVTAIWIIGWIINAIIALLNMLSTPVGLVGLTIGGLAAGASLLANPKRQMPIGLIAYTFIRSVFNLIRSIEPLVYVIIFAVWVGIGPFAGILSLTIHTAASLGKLFSEQVEGISEGPLEAITATGANRIQTIVFAVIPQIVPPFIAFTLYRWDINVRMSTIIGFGGGGGIGFVLAQAINLLKYREASVMMLGIALVVIILDYTSSKVRSKIM